MTFQFPDLDTFRLALSAGVVPAEVALAPAAVAFDAEGRPAVETAVEVPKEAIDALKRLGVKATRRALAGTPEAVANWLQVLPVERGAGAPQISAQAPVLFELPSADGLPALVGEMLRLGNDRQGYRRHASPDDPHGNRVLLRVVGPPYYTLLRALEPRADEPGGGLRAYLEAAPRVWVEVGHAHPMADRLRVAEGQMVLIRPPRGWTFVEEAPFRDVYDLLRFPLTAQTAHGTEADAPERIEVPLRLAAGNAADVPELWVLRADPIRRLDELVRDSSDALVQRLTFAVASDGHGVEAVVLRVRPSKGAPPALPLEEAVGFKPHSKLPNLFVPVGKRLHPALRRDAVRKHLAEDPDRVVWLYPAADGKSFVPESLPDGAFRSLEDWVDYVVQAERQPLADWIEAAQFDFDRFVCREGPPSGPRDPGREPRVREPEEKAPGKAAGGRTKSGAKEAATAEYVPAPIEERKPNEWLLKRKELEDRFLEVEGPLDAPDRQALWPQLAVANARAGDKVEEASVCWLNAAWNADGPAPSEWVAGWAASERRAGTGPLDAAEFDGQLQLPNPSAGESRALLAAFLALADPVPPDWLGVRLSALQSYVERHERSLPIRAVWLAAHRLSQLAGSDVLGLARVRDRLLRRLLEEGLSPERDLPGFLRYAGLRDSERLRAVRERAEDLHGTVRKWAQHVPATLPYVDLYFAFALARLGEASGSRKLLEEGRTAMESKVDESADERTTSSLVKNFLYTAYRYRIEQALAGRPHSGQLPQDLLHELQKMDVRGENITLNNPHRMARFVVDRMRDQSRILEPQERLDPYGSISKKQGELSAELLQLYEIADPLHLRDRARRIWKASEGKLTVEMRLLLLQELLALSPRVGESFSLELFQHVAATLDPTSIRATGQESTSFGKDQGVLLERSLFLAANYDLPDYVELFTSLLVQLLHNKNNVQTKFAIVNLALRQCRKGMHKLGLRDALDRLLTKLNAELFAEKSIEDLKRQYSGDTGTWAAALQAHLNLSAGWLALGATERAIPTVEAARKILLQPSRGQWTFLAYAEVAKAYLVALGHIDYQIGIEYIHEFFTKMDKSLVVNTFTTAPHFSRLHLNLVEETVLTIVSDDFIVGPAGRRWLEEDEYLVRRRIHRDMRRHLDRSEL